MNFVENAVKFVLDNLAWGVLGVGIFVIVKLVISKNYTSAIISFVVFGVVYVLCLDPMILGNFGNVVKGIIGF